jgi:hypothetical protein
MLMAIESPLPFVGRYDRVLMRAIHGELNRWGKWHEDHSDYQGYPTANILETYIGASRTGEPGHRVLALDMPDGVWATHHNVLRLSLDLQDIVIAQYMHTTKEDGTAWTMQEKCLRLGIPRAIFSQKLHKAKRRIAGLDG